MSIARVTRHQRFTRRNPCPICGGGDDDPRGKGLRCAGFRSTDDRWVYCESARYAGRLPLNEHTSPPTYRHRGIGACWCGVAHNINAQPQSFKAETPSHRPQSQARTLRDEKPFRSPPQRLPDGWNLIAAYPYEDVSGQPIYQVLRYEKLNPNSDPNKEKPDKRFLQARAVGPNLWAMGMKGVTRLLYRLPELHAAPADEPVFVAEGEKCVDLLRKLGLIATCTVGGAGQSHLTPSIREELRDRHVVILPDNDGPDPEHPQSGYAGQRHAQQIACALSNVARSIRVLEFPSLPLKGDIEQWLQAGGTVEKLKELAARAPLAENWAPPQEDTQTQQQRPQPTDDPTAALDEYYDSTPSANLKVSVADRLLALAADVELFHDPGNCSYATVWCNDHYETWPLNSRSFKRWLGWRFHELDHKVAPSSTLNDVIGALEGKALFEGLETPVFMRLAEHNGAIYLDLANTQWQVVEISATGWQLVTNPPIKFRRAKAMLPLPIPQQGGDLNDLRDFVNVDSEQWPLVVGWLLGALRPKGPFPVLGLSGEQGSANTTLARVLRALVDPNTAPVRSEPRDLRDLAIAANNSWMPVFDNLSSISIWLSDALCRLSTEGGFSTRTLYENDEETIFNAKRPCILTGIEDVVKRADLLHRSILLHLPTIPEQKRCTEESFWAGFEARRPAILGTLLTAAAASLSEWPKTKLTGHPRLADFAKWVVAAESSGVLDWKHGTFLDTYAGNRIYANTLALESSPVAIALLDLLEQQISWAGTVTELLAALTRIVARDGSRPSQWPTSAEGLAGALRRAEPNLRAIGITIERQRCSDARGTRRMVIQRHQGATPSMSLPESSDT